MYVHKHTYVHIFPMPASPCPIGPTAPANFEGSTPSAAEKGSNVAITVKCIVRTHGLSIHTQISKTVIVKFFVYVYGLGIRMQILKT
jgi:hypothetical protein